MVSMKAVGSLNDFVREHMLEPFGRRFVDGLVPFPGPITARSRCRRGGPPPALEANLAPLLDDYDTYSGHVAEGGAARPAEALRFISPSGPASSTRPISARAIVTWQCREANSPTSTTSSPTCRAGSTGCGIEQAGLRRRSRSPRSDSRSPRFRNGSIRTGRTARHHSVSPR